VTQKTVGYVELEWTCQRCGTRNPGTVKTCQSCGAAMAQEDKFELPAEAKLITDPAKLVSAERGPDIHCPDCGARNVAGAPKCTQCGGPLTEGQARAAGQVLGAHQTGPVPDVQCPFCGTLNPASAVKCSKCGGALLKAPAPAPAAPAAPAKGMSRWAIILAVLGVVICIGAIVLITSLTGRTTDTLATVQSVAWERSIPVLEQRPVKHEDWQDELPAGVQKGDCSKKLRKTQDEPAPGAEEVCGTPYTKDQGSGVGKVVQDCKYNIYDQWCSYTLLEWQVVSQLRAAGNDLNPQWPQMTLTANQRAGEKPVEKYQVVFKLEDKAETKQYTPDNADEFAQYAVGSAWTLKINGLGHVTEASPAK